MPVPQITVTIDTKDDTYTFTTANPTVTPGSQSLPVPLGGYVTIGSGNANAGIVIVATLPASATVTTPFDPPLAPVGTTLDTYTFTAIGEVTLSVPSYNGRPLTGTPLTVAAFTTLTLTEAGSQTPSISFGAIVSLFTGYTTNADTTAGLFVGQGSQISIASTGSSYIVNDVDENPYNVTTQSSKTVPLVGTINVSSLKKPHSGA